MAGVFGGQPRRLGRLRQRNRPWEYFGTQAGAIVGYLKLCLIPRPLVLDYGTGLAHGAREILPYFTVLALLALATAVALWRWPKVGFLGACFFFILAPTSSIVPVATQTVAEHRMYLPLAAVVIGLVLGGHAVGRSLVRRQWLPRSGADILGGCIVVVAAFLLATLTFQRNADYGSKLSIWLDTAGKAPGNDRARL